MGSAFCRVLASFGEDFVSLSSRDCDVRDGAGVEEQLARHRPRLIINAVALMGVDACESDPQGAFAVNSLFPKQLCRVAETCDATVVHFSTDAVFDGRKNGAYDENDAAIPLNLYGISKYAGDCLVLAHRRHYVFRLPLLFGPGGGEQFVDTMISRLAVGKDVRVARDVVTSPGYTLDVAREVLRGVTGGMKPGLYHLASLQPASLYDLITEFTNCLDLPGKVYPASWRDFPVSGLRPNTTPMTSVKGMRLPSWQDAVRSYCGMLRTQQAGGKRWRR